MPLDADAWKLANQHMGHGPKFDAHADKSEAIRIIRERNGMRAPRQRHQQLGAAAPAVDILAAMQTNAQARHVLGIVSTRLQQGYQAAETFPFSASHSFPGGSDAKSAAIDLLNQANTYAQRVYATIPDNTDSVSAKTRKTVGIAVKNALRATKLVSSAANNLNQSLLQDLVDYLQGKAKNSLGFDIPKPIIWSVVAVGGALTLFIVVRLLLRVATGGLAGALEEAEADALAIVDQARRRRHGRSVHTIS